MEIVLQVSLMLGGLFLFYLCHLAYRRNWKWNSWVLAILGISALAFAQPSVQGFLKSGVMAQLLKYGEKLNEFQKTVGNQEMTIRQHQEALNAQQKEIAAHQSELANLQKQVASAQKEMLAASSQSASAIAGAEKTIIEAKVDIEKQRADIRDVKHLVSGLLSSMQTEAFSEVDGSRLIVLALDGKKQGEVNAHIFFLLKHVPFRDSVRLKFHLFDQPPSSYQVSSNVILFNWAGSPNELKNDSLKLKQFYVEYIPDKETSEQAVSSVTISEVSDKSIGVTFSPELKKPFSIPRFKSLDQ